MYRLISYSVLLIAFAIPSAVFADIYGTSTTSQTDMMRGSDDTMQNDQVDGDSMQGDMMQQDKLQSDTMQNDNMATEQHEMDEQHTEQLNVDLEKGADTSY